MGEGREKAIILKRQSAIFNAGEYRIACFYFSLMSSTKAPPKKSVGCHTMMVGERIRETREIKGMSVRKLAAMVEVSASLISQIETGKVDPSLSTLRKIAIALDVPLFSLVLTDGSAPTRVIRSQERRLVVFPKAGLSYDIIHSDPNKRMGVMIGTLSPKGATSETLLNHPGEECLVILEGAMTVELADEVIELQEGDSLYFDSSIPHLLRNSKNRACRFYLIITPPKF